VCPPVSVCCCSLRRRSSSTLFPYTTLFRSSLVLLVAVALAAHFVMTSTVFGRSVYSMGGNPAAARLAGININRMRLYIFTISGRSEEHTSELQSRENLVCRLLLEKKNTRYV